MDGKCGASVAFDYDTQLDVDAEAQILLPSSVTQQTNDLLQLVEIARALVQHVPRLTDTTSAAAGGGLSSRAPPWQDLARRG